MKPLELFGYLVLALLATTVAILVNTMLLLPFICGK